MKILILLFSLFFSVGALAQVNGNGAYTVKRTASFDVKKPLLIVDGKISEREITDTSKLLSVNMMMNNDSAKAVYGDKAQNGVIIVITKTYAQKKYQKKLSTFSKEYKEYLSQNKNNDSGIIYFVLDGKDLTFLKPASIELYNVSQKDILKVEFGKKESIDAVTITVAITTK